MEERDGDGRGTEALAGRLARNARKLSWDALASPRVLGFALARAWVYLLFVDASASFVTWDGSAVPGAVFSVSSAALFLALVVPAFVSERFGRLMRRPGVRWLALASTCLGTLLVASSAAPGVWQSALCVVGGVLTGVGSGVIDLGWGEVYRDVPSQQTCLEAPFAFFLAAAVHLGVSNLPSVAACVVVALMPLASGLVLFGTLGAWSPASRPVALPVPISPSRFAVRIGACACLVGLADGIVRAVFLSASGIGVREFFCGPLLGASVITLLVIWGCTLVLPRFELRGVYKSSVVIMAFCFQLLPVVLGTQAQCVLALAGYGTFNVLIWILLADIAHTYRVSSTTVFGVGWGMVTVGVLLGALVGRRVCEAFAPFTPQAISGVTLVATLGILLSYMFILKESDLEELTTLGERRQELHEGEGASRGGDDRERMPRFTNRCRQVADAHGLTEREAEVMTLYAKGRSYARLQEELGLSRGTVTTHLRHVYEKLGVHDKQAMLDLIERRRVSGPRE